MNLTKHASIRKQQRGISTSTIELLLLFGERYTNRNGTETVYFDKKARQEINNRTNGMAGKRTGAMDAYAVVDSERIITVGHRFRKTGNPGQI